MYEICVWQALRDRLRCKEIWVVGADKWQNPDDDLPADFENCRLDHYAKLNQPLDPQIFVDALQTEHRNELGLLDEALPTLDWLTISERNGGAIKLTPLDMAPEPVGLRSLKAEVGRRWGTIQLLDILKEADLRIGFTSEAVPVGSRETLNRAVLQERILLVLYAYGTNAGIRHLAHGEHNHSEDDLRYVRRRYLSVEAARRMAIEIANATFAARDEHIWGNSTTVASDSTHFAAYDQNLLTEWHSRYGGKGVLIYWHVEKNSMAIHSQLLSCTASEVHAMVEGVARHGTEMNVEGNYVDSHPVYQAMLELGRVQKTIFIARYLRLRELQREITAGLNVVEAFNGANSHIRYGNGGGFTTNRRDDQELGMLCLHILQAALVYINTLMIQHILADPARTDSLTDADYRGLTPLFWSHVTPYGIFKLDMNRRLILTDTDRQRLR